MGQLITYSQIDTAIQNRMSNQAPSVSKRLEAINDSMQELYSEFDVETGKRKLISYLVPDGKPIDISGLVTDFKHPSDMRHQAPNKHNEEFGYIDDDLFVVHIGEGKNLNEFAVVNNNAGLFLKLNSVIGPTKKQLHNMGSLTDNGTWTTDAVNSDATNLTTSEVVVLEQNANIQFDADVSQSSNHYTLIENSTMDAIDLSDYNGLGRAKFWVYIPAITNFTSVELRWGSDSSNYWSAAVTTQADGSDFAVGWNFVDIGWADATQTGTVTNTSSGYLAVKMNYASGYTDAANFRVEAINMFLPIPMELTYYTLFTALDADGTFQQDLDTDSDDKVLLPIRFKELLLVKCLVKLWPEAVGDDEENQVRRLESQEKKLTKLLHIDIGNKVKTPSTKMKTRKMW